MGNLALLALRIVLVMGLAGSLFVQAVMVPLLAVDIEDAPAAVRVPVIVIVLACRVPLRRRRDRRDRGGVGAHVRTRCHAGAG
jgi:hypothetical protein